MTLKRIYALQWFFDRGEVAWFARSENPPSRAMRSAMIKDGQLTTRKQGDWKPVLFFLTDKGRRDLHEATQ